MQRIGRRPVSYTKSATKDLSTFTNISRLFNNYSRAANRGLIERAFSGTDFLRGVPAAARDGFATFPEKFACGEKVPMGMPESKQNATAVAGVSVAEMVFPLYYVYKRLASSR